MVRAPAPPQYVGGSKNSIEASVGSVFNEVLLPPLHLQTDLGPVPHPTKQEVRYQDSRSVRDFIFGILHKNLAAPLGTRLPSSKLLSDPTATVLNPSDLGPPLLGDQRKLEVNQLNKGVTLIERPHELFDLYKGDKSGDVNASHYLGEAISQLHGTYILSRIGDGLVVVDERGVQRVRFLRLQPAHALCVCSMRQPAAQAPS